MSPRRLQGWEPTVTRVREFAPVVWWQPWTWFRVLSEVTFTEPEWDAGQVAYLLALKVVEADMGSHGVPLSEAFDPANQFKFKGQDAPRVDFAEKARRDAEEAFYKLHDKKDNPVNRNGHVWGVTKRD